MRGSIYRSIGYRWILCIQVSFDSYLSELQDAANTRTYLGADDVEAGAVVVIGTQPIVVDW